MRALKGQSAQELSVKTFSDPMLQQLTDANHADKFARGLWLDLHLQVHLHLHDVPDLYLRPGNVLGHQPMGIVEQMVAQINHVRPGDRVVITSPADIDALTSCYPVLRLAQPINHPNSGGRDSCSRPAKAA